MTTPTAPSAPPRTAERLLAALGADPELRDLFLGDLAEEHAIRAAYDGERAARRWYWREAFRVAPYLLRDAAGRLRGRDVARLAVAVLTAYLCATIVGGVVYAAAVRTVMPLGFGPGTLSALLALNVATHVLGGYIAAALDGRRPLVAALALGLAWSGARLVITAADGNDTPDWAVWVGAGRLALSVAAVALGGVLRVAPARGARR
jgi:hypothetical protein